MMGKLLDFSLFALIGQLVICLVQGERQINAVPGR